MDTKTQHSARKPLWQQLTRSRCGEKISTSPFLESREPVMSRAFVKENDSDTPPELPELPVSPGPNPVTARGLALLRARYEHNLARQAALGDAISAEDKLQRAELQREQRWLDARLGNAQLRQPHGHGDSVEFGCRVTLVDETDSEYRYRIVGEDEASPEHGRISWRSPLAVALNGAQVGDERVWSRPAGALRVEVIAIDCTPEATG